MLRRLLPALLIVPFAMACGAPKSAPTTPGDAPQPESPAKTPEGGGADTDSTTGVPTADPASTPEPDASEPPTKTPGASAPSDTPNTSTHKKPSSRAVPQAELTDEEELQLSKPSKSLLRGKAEAGTATEAELRQLKALCMLDGDKPCRDLATEKLKSFKK